MEVFCAETIYFQYFPGSDLSTGKVIAIITSDGKHICRILREKSKLNPTLWLRYVDLTLI